ncbi:MAG TPA: D-aminoacyl-tRNA deacylase [Candidatus Binatia bacterium]|nr:D-aminoacyl-tRNA deacylase [Candidatus Binatia bacterium]
MRAVIQRVTKAQVTVGENIVGRITSGLCILLGVSRDDEVADADFLSDKIKNLRIFEDQEGKMNLSLVAARGEVLVVSQFTLYASCKKGNRPSFTDAAPLAHAENLYNHFIGRLRDAGVPVATGQFQAKMKVSLVNDGPVTFVLES